jgi:hypothetical protein
MLVPGSDKNGTVNTKTTNRKRDFKVKSIPIMFISSSQSTVGYKNPEQRHCKAYGMSLLGHYV